MSIYSIYFCYQPTKNMKYIGPKSSVIVPIQKHKKSLIEHNIDYVCKLFNDQDTKHHIVVGFEAEKTLKLLKDIKNLSYNIVLDYKNTNHGKIIKDTLLKYDRTKFDGLFIISDVSYLITQNINLDPNNNYIFTVSKDGNNQDMTCNVVEGKVEHISYGTSTNYWNGMCYFNNETIRLLKHINNLKFTDPLFLFEIVNYLIDNGIKFDHFPLKPRQYSYVSNNILKSSKVYND